MRLRRGRQSASSEVKRRSAARTSTSSPRARQRASGRSGSARVLSTTCTCGGRCSSRKVMPAAIVRAVDEVVVVEHQPHLAGCPRELVEQRGQHGVGRLGVRPSSSSAAASTAGTACCTAVTTPGPERRGVVSPRRRARATRPGGRPRLREPRGEQGRLPEPGRGRHQGEPAVHAVGEPVHAGGGGPPRRGARGGRRAWSRPEGVPRVLIPPEHRREVAPRAHRTPGVRGRPGGGRDVTASGQESRSMHHGRHAIAFSERSAPSRPASRGRRR